MIGGVSDDVASSASLSVRGGGQGSLPPFALVSKLGVVD